MSHVRSNPIESYISKTFVNEPEDLTRVREALRQDGKEGINVGAAEGKLLQLLCKLVSAKTIVEIGTLYAYSTLWMAKCLPEDGSVYSLEFSPENYKAASKLVAESNEKNKIEILHGDAKETMYTLDVTPDLIFIDADKSGYPEYLKWALEKVRVGGLIVGDNTLLFGHMVGMDRGMKVSDKAKQAMTEFNETLAKHPNFFSIMIPTFEGMTVGLRIQ